MFTRIVSMQVKPNATREFIESLDKKVLPTLRKQKGFKDEMLFVDPGGPEVIAISFWESKDNAEQYVRAAYQDVLKAMGNVVQGTPEVLSYEVCSSTIPKITARA
jgi:heme-degrading monooxygenase HmoA